MQVQMEVEECTGNSAAGVTDLCELSDIGAGNRTQILLKTLGTLNGSSQPQKTELNTFLIQKLLQYSYEELEEIKNV